MHAGSFQPCGYRAFGPEPSDIHQSLNQIAALAEAKDLGKYCAQVMADDASIRRDITSGDRRFLLRIAPYARESGRSAGVVLTFTNVTAFRASLEQAVYEREYTKAILNTVSNPLVVLDAELRVQSANRAFYDMFGVSRERAQGIPLRTLGGDDWRASGMWASLTAILRGEEDFQGLEAEREFPSLGRAGAARRTAPLSDRERHHSPGVARHHGTQARRGRAIRRRTAISRDGGRASGRGLHDRCPRAAHPFQSGCSRICRPHSRAGRRPLVCDVEALSSRRQPNAAQEAPMAIALKEKRPIRGGHAIAERPDGERRWFEPYPTPLFDATGRLSGAINMLLDITERKRAEEALREADRRKDEFLALLAHELRNPLAPIRTGLELIRISGDTPQSVRRVRAMMDRQVSQMVRLIDDLLDVSRIASGKIVLQRAPTSVSELVHSAIEAHRTAIEAANIDLTIDLPAQPCVIDADSTRFVQVLSNVLHNASKFTPAQGKIRISVEGCAADDMPQVAITISDTGAGISHDLLPKVFELFVQAEAATERTHGGLGIGFALARRLIEMHGGGITAHSDGPGKGSTFVITMPVCQLMPRDRHPQRATCPMSRAGSSSSMTTRMPLIRCRCSSNNSGVRREWLTMPSAALPQSSSLNLTLCSWTSACLAWTDTKRVGGFDGSRPSGISSSLR